MKYTPLSNSIFLPTFRNCQHIIQSPYSWSRLRLPVYSADIDCDDAYGLLGFVASEQPPFKPTSTVLRTLAQPLALIL
ncbi:uncharacterized protein EAE98_008178 [Botrytis deweyae]|uniref:Uncharacterized protein n=1 Tax=Botrytis deweyae TaxID=2478750 RepID=A0ABQ7IEZ0_9HELO|nr:uncharacterized protein EAE98_008178 [Botrytis deweyae]KAF7921967.1 hypothetical protein EAE98_008178 [Botrytis deweyae]